MQHTKLKVSFRGCLVTTFALLGCCEQVVGNHYQYMLRWHPRRTAGIPAGGREALSHERLVVGSHHRTLSNVRPHAKYQHTRYNIPEKWTHKKCWNTLTNATHYTCVINLQYVFCNVTARSFVDVFPTTTINGVASPRVCRNHGSYILTKFWGEKKNFCNMPDVYYRII